MTPAYYEMITLLQECREEIIEAERCGLPLNVEGDDAIRRARTMLSAHILNDQSPGSIMLSDRFLSAKAEAAGDLTFEQLDQVQLERLALNLTIPRSR